MGIKIYGKAENARTRAMLAVAKHENVPVELCSTEEADFASNFPLKKMPALVDGDFVLSETMAVAVYRELSLCQRLEGPFR